MFAHFGCLLLRNDCIRFDDFGSWMCLLLLLLLLLSEQANECVRVSLSVASENLFKYVCTYGIIRLHKNVNCWIYLQQFCFYRTNTATHMHCLSPKELISAGTISFYWSAMRNGVFLSLLQEIKQCWESFL